MTTQKLNELKILETKYKVVIMCIMCTVFALLIPFWSGFLFCLFGSIVLAGIFLSVQESLSLFAYIFFFTALSGRADGTHYAFCLVFFGILLKYIYQVVCKQVRIAKYPLVISIIFWLCSILPLWNYSHFFGIAMAFMFLGPIYLIYIYRDKIDMIRINRYLFAGLVVSATLGLLLFKILNISQYSLIIEGGRMKFFTDNANSISFAGVIIIAGYILTILKKRINWWTGILNISITIFFAAQSGSKSFLLGLGLLIFITTLILLFKNKKIALVVFASIILFGALMYFCFRSYFDYMLGRFLYSGTISIESVTTGRWEVWQIFLNNQFSKPINIWLGMGAWTEIFLPVNSNTMLGCHSIYLEFFYYFGIVGIINLILLIWSYSHTTQKEKGKVNLIIKVEDVLPLLMVFVMGVGEMVIFNRKSVFLIFAILYIFNGSKYMLKKSEKYERLKHIQHLRKNKGDFKK